MGLDINNGSCFQALPLTFGNMVSDWLWVTLGQTDTIYM